MTATPSPRGTTMDLAATRSMRNLAQKAGQTLETRIIGVSMEPTLAKGARVQIQWTADRPLREDDIVVCQLKDVLFVHRVVYCGETGYRKNFVITRGDGHILCDPPTPKNQIIGHVVAADDHGTWRAPGPAPLRSRIVQACSAIHQRVVELSLLVHFEFARRVAGTSLIVAKFARKVVSRLRRK